MDLYRFCVVLYAVAIVLLGPRQQPIQPMSGSLQNAVAASLVPAGVKAQWAAQQGNPGHVEPPPGVHCTPAGWVVDGKQTSDHPCKCKRTCTMAQDTDEDGNLVGPVKPHVTEDAQCNVYCYKDHCACPTNCDDCDKDKEKKE